MTSDRTCIRGCTQKGIHFATCPDYGKAESFAEARAAGVQNIGYTPTCTGCAPREAHGESLLCGKCFGRSRKLLDDLPDLIARIRSIIDPSKATPSDKEPGGRAPSEPLAAVGSDPLDAVIACENVWSWWLRWGEDLQLMSNRLEAGPVFDMLLERHRPEEGLRPWWSVQDAVDTYGVERRPGRNEKPWEDVEEDRELARFPVPKSEFLMRPEAERLAGSKATLDRWIRNGLLARAGKVQYGRETVSWFRTSELEAVRDRMAESKGGRPRKLAAVLNEEETHA